MHGRSERVSTAEWLVDISEAAGAKLPSGYGWTAITTCGQPHCDGERGADMAIAEVTRITADPSRREQDREYGHKVFDGIAARDGCETVIILVDGADALGVTIWRDQAAYDAYAKDRDALVGDAERETKSSLDDTRFYEVEYRS
jgi:quinol monooxygenase YgiN